jgi:hypothetical protein
MKYAVKMGSGALMYTPSSIKIGLGIHRHAESVLINTGRRVELNPLRSYS